MTSAEDIEGMLPPEQCKCREGLEVVSKKDKHFLELSDHSPESSRQKAATSSGRLTLTVLVSLSVVSHHIIFRE